jgi:hypothetical protein
MFFDDNEYDVQDEEESTAENNLERIQNIALFNFTWTEIRDKEDPADKGVIWAAKFEQQIEDGFQNLEKLILIYHAYEDGNGSINSDEKVKLQTEEGQDKVREIIHEMFQREKQKRPNCSVPKIFFIHEDSEAAKEYLI